MTLLILVLLFELLFFVPSGLGAGAGGGGRGDGGERCRCLGGLGLAGRGLRVLDLPGGQ